MEKPTGVIQKIIESLQQINTLDVYSPIEKDIILHNLRAAYMIFLNIPVKEENTEERVEKLFVVENEENLLLDGEIIEEEMVQEIEMEDEPQEIEEVVNIEEEGGMQEAESNEEEEGNIEAENLLPIEEIVEEKMEEPSEEELIEDIEEEEIHEELPQELEEVTIIDEVVEEVEAIIEEEIHEVSNVPEVLEAPVEKTIASEPPNVPQEILHDDILEFIPDAQPQVTTLFDEMTILKPEKKSLNDLLTEKKDDNSIGTRFQQSYIPDLTKAIAINEKFTFIRELFRNSGVDFSNAIQKLNECENIDAAFVLMEDLKHQYIWDTTSSAYLTLCDLVRRRFL
jgi:hypothetical protein